MIDPSIRSKLKISEEEYLKRKEAIDFTNNSFALEGYIPDQELYNLSELFIFGEITSEEFTEKAFNYINKDGK